MADAKYALHWTHKCMYNLSLGCVLVAVKMPAKLPDAGWEEGLPTFAASQYVAEQPQ